MREDLFNLAVNPKDEKRVHRILKFVTAEYVEPKVKSFGLPRRLLRVSRRQVVHSQHMGLDGFGRPCRSHFAPPEVHRT